MIEERADAERPKAQVLPPSAKSPGDTGYRRGSRRSWPAPRSIGERALKTPDQQGSCNKGISGDQPRDQLASQPWGCWHLVVRE